MVKTGGESVVVVVDEVGGFVGQRGGEVDRAMEREAEKSSGEIDFRFLKDIVHFSLGREVGRRMCTKIARWSEM